MAPTQQERTEFGRRFPQLFKSDAPPITTTTAEEIKELCEAYGLAGPAGSSARCSERIVQSRDSRRKKHSS